MSRFSVVSRLAHFNTDLLVFQAEVSQLKDSVHSGMNRNLPPYLVPDSTALLDTMHLIKHLVYSAKFIIIIPLCGTFAPYMI